jgi:hypothetical protein
MAIMVAESSSYLKPAIGSKIVSMVYAGLPEAADGVKVSEVLTRPWLSRATVDV